MIQRNSSLLKDLIWQIEAGIDECIGDEPLNHFTEPPTGVVDKKSVKFDNKVTTDYSNSKPRNLNSVSDISSSPEPIISHSLPEAPRSNSSDTERAILNAVSISETTNSVSDLRAAVENFKECKLEKTAINTVFSDGELSSKVMLIGDVPGADEDRKGIPFIGSSGQLLDKMLASINLNRSSCYVTNLVFWRPPGDRAPTSDEIAVCMPFVKRHIELVSPELLVLLGGSVSKALLGMKESITKIHGQWFEYSTSKMVAPIVAIPLYHPVHLLSSPAYKRDAWHDLLKIKEKLTNK